MNLADIFSKVSDLNYSNRGLVIIGTICLTLFFSIGMFNLRMETDPQNLWVSQDSIGFEQEMNFNDQFGAFFRT